MKNRLLKYLAVGAGAYVVEMLFLFLLVHLIRFGSVGSVALSYWVGLVVAFIAQKLITFENYQKKAHLIARQIFEYCLLVGFNYLFTLFLVYILDKYFSVYLIRTFAIILCTFWNYLIYKRIFRQHAN